MTKTSKNKTKLIVRT